jgi:hypothetical protein
MKLSFSKNAGMKSKTFNIKSSIDKLLKVQTLIFEGDLGISNANDIGKTIQSISFSGDKVVIHLRSVVKLDITFIQLIRALQIALENDGKKTEIITEFTQEIERSMISSGVDKIILKHK